MCIATCAWLQNNALPSPQFLLSRNNLIEKNTYWGVYCLAECLTDYGYANPNIENNVITQNGSGGIYLYADGDGPFGWYGTVDRAYVAPDIIGNEIHDNNGPAINCKAEGVWTNGSPNDHWSYAYVQPKIIRNIIANNSQVLNITCPRYNHSRGRLSQAEIEIDHVTCWSNGDTEISAADSSQVLISNSIFWGPDISNLQTTTGASIEISYSDFTQNYPGIGNIQIDPEFVTPDNNNFTLLMTSPCIDAGDPNSNNDPDGTIADMGALFYPQNHQGEIPYYKDLVEGWTWFSLNVQNDDMSPGNLLNCATDGDYIKNQTQSATYYDGYGWYGTLADNGLELKSLYKVKAVNPCAADYMGMAIDVASTPIDIVSGWNWIAYLPQEPISIQPTNDALASLTLEEGDYIKNQTESATYYAGFGWYGSLEDMVPTDGYMMRKLSPDVLIYPEGPAAPTSEKKSDVVVKDLGASFDPHQFEFSGSLTAKVYVDGVLSGGEQDLVMAYVDGELRGIVGGIYFKPTESFAYPMMVYSNVSEGEMLTFRYYDAEQDQLYPCEGTLTFYEDMIVANAFESFDLNVNSIVGVDDTFGVNEMSLKVYPNPFKDEIPEWPVMHIASE